MLNPWGKSRDRKRVVTGQGAARDDLPDLSSPGWLAKYLGDPEPGAAQRPTEVTQSELVADPTPAAPEVSPRPDLSAAEMGASFRRHPPYGERAWTEGVGAQWLESMRTHRPHDLPTGDETYPAETWERWGRQAWEKDRVRSAGMEETLEEVSGISDLLASTPEIVAEAIEARGAERSAPGGLAD